MSFLDWQVGDRVVCIRPRPACAPADAIYPAVNHVYTIRELRDDTRLGGKGVVVLLKGIDNSHFIGRFSADGGYYVEPGFAPKGFRKVQPRKTDISIFTAMLDHDRTPMPADGEWRELDEVPLS